uniref:Site-2 protease family protein n=1 Tax=Desulfobacca acetoxidans TaxID=60893 RepID=A0A7C3UYA2_9BACT
MNFAALLDMSLMAVVLLFSVIVHEVAHGYVALLNGDPTARLAGRLTLNPLPHIDPIGTILLPAILLLSGSRLLFGWARPVPVNPSYFRNYRLGEVTTSFAGPASNLLLALAFSYLLRLNLGGPGLLLLAYYGCIINIFLALFNLIPIPPLAGSHLVAAFLPYRLLQYYRYLEPVGFVIILLLFYTGLMGAILMPLYRQIARFLQVPMVF